MFSLESFYNIVYTNLLKPIGGNGFYFSNFGSTDPQDLVLITDVVDQDTSSWTLTDWSAKRFTFAVFHDQEPIYTDSVEQLWNPDVATETWHSFQIVRQHRDFWLFANSEHSTAKSDLLESHTNLHNWYYFYHGFAALDWYRNCQYQPPIRKYTKLFICFNHLVTKKRSYRLNLIARLLERGLDQHGFISLVQQDTARLIKQEIFDPNTELSQDSRKLIAQVMLPDPPRLTIDIDQPHGALSADDNLETLAQGLFHVVTETVFYDVKLHLTEKVFKPIVARRPFFLVANAGNLTYLKRYGFRTFDAWIDETYDMECDPDTRIIMIVNELERLSKLSPDDLDRMYKDMQATLDYNFEWFYGGFRQVIVDELVDNFQACLVRHNETANNCIDYSQINFDEVKHRLSG
jgi:hypothetical protein